ncbi:MAG: putative transcriptional regulator, GntR family [Solirubrobacterales bacterium]|jgi:2-aminoadipate transaminase|nr:putative transcriptional regulator, GntR family [Solirubrobacterales bacterium]
MPDWPALFAQRVADRGDAEITAILAGVPPGVLSVTGGFPNPKTFPTDLIEDLVAQILRDDAGVALQYAPSEGIPSVREFLVERQEQLQGRRPAVAELIVTSGGMECITLACQALVDPGDAIVVEAPTYLGALMAFRGYGPEIHGVASDDDGMVVDELAERLAAGLRPKFVYVIPEFQNPSGRTLSLPRREALVELCRRHGVLILEDVAYREISFDGGALPSLWSLAPDVVVQAGTFSKIFCPGVRLGWAVGPDEVIAQLGAAKQTTDQCAGALGQKLVEAYGRAGHFERQIPVARELYGSHWRTVERALREHLPEGCEWSVPTGGFFTWLTLPEGIDTVAMRPAAIEAGVAYVAGAPFYAGAEGANELRLSFSYLPESELRDAVARLSGVIADTIAAA